jgi:hypothetical protein
MPSSHRQFPKREHTKNKFQKSWHVLAAQKPPHKTPQLPPNPPQTHHVFTTIKHHKVAKPAAKTTLLPGKIISPNQGSLSPFRHQSR